MQMNNTMFWLTWALGVGLFLLCIYAKLFIPSANTQLPPVSNLAIPLLVLMTVGVIRLLLSTCKDRLRVFNLSRILYPELDLFETHEERDTNLVTAMKARRRNPKFWIASALPAVVAYPAVKMLMAMLSQYNANNVQRLIVLLLCIVAFSWAIHYVINRTFRDPVRRALRKQLAEKDVAICVACGYDLRGQHEPRCPECGTPFDERLMARRSEDC